MINHKACEWLIKNADIPILYRIFRELLHDIKTAKKIESELLENPTVLSWIKNLKPNIPPQHKSMEHGSFDFCFENAILKIINFGLHGDLPQVVDAVNFYVHNMKNTVVPYRKGQLFFAILISNLLSMVDIKDEKTLQYMLGSLDEMYNFTKKKNYDIYLSKEKITELTRIPKIWKDNKNFIKPKITKELGFSYPLIYDILGMHKLYNLKNPHVNKKIDNIINYISTDEFHKKISDGYGILTEENGTYHSMGWDPKYPGWCNVTDYMEKGNVPKLLFFAQYIVKYPLALKTKWFRDLMNYLEKYRTERSTYIFLKEWMKESSGDAVHGYHM